MQQALTKDPSTPSSLTGRHCPSTTNSFSKGRQACPRLPLLQGPAACPPRRQETPPDPRHQLHRYESALRGCSGDETALRVMGTFQEPPNTCFSHPCLRFRGSENFQDFMFIFTSHRLMSGTCNLELSKSDLACKAGEENFEREGRCLPTARRLMPQPHEIGQFWPIGYRTRYDSHLQRMCAIFFIENKIDITGPPHPCGPSRTPCILRRGGRLPCAISRNGFPAYPGGMRLREPS